jgi:signal transduction histidine kinase
MHAHHMQEKQLLLKQGNIWNAFREKSGNIDTHIKGEYDIVEGINTAGLELDEPRDTSVYYPNPKKTLPFKILTSQLQSNQKNYLVTTYVSEREISHLIIKVFITEAAILLLLLIAIVVLNLKSSRRLWRPFFSTMEKINNYDITYSSSLALPGETGTREFDELNKTVTGMISNVNTSYLNQKQFVENASHEMQTPLAIIRSKLELLINQPDLTEKNASLLGDITDANNRLSQMNRTLLLLAKIENNQFPETEEIDFSDLLNKIIQDFKNHYENFPGITITVESGVIVSANRSLIEILISNLVKNAVVHNLSDGKINVTLSQSHLLIENTGPALTTSPDDLFERFKKGSHETKTTGLGLALVKQICNLYHFTAWYNYESEWHRVAVIFN